jgi:hypothetical protein
VLISLGVVRPDPLGTDVSKYDFSSPADTLRSVNSMVARQDLRAAWQLLKGTLQAEPNPDLKLFLADKVNITVLKSVEVSSSADPKNNGTVVSFVKFTVAGVDYYTVQYFRKDQANRFNLGGTFYVPYSTAKSA